MRNTFFKKNESPTRDTPYRQVELEHHGSHGWQVQLIASERAGREHGKVLETIPVRNFEEGLEKHNEMYRKLQAEGWKLHAHAWRKFLETGLTW
jgi:hypothetical protein